MACQTVMSTGLRGALAIAPSGHLPAAVPPPPPPVPPLPLSLPLLHAATSRPVMIATAPMRDHGRDIRSLSLHGAGRQTSDELLLEHEQQDEQRQRGEHRARQGHVDVVDRLTPQLAQTDLHRAEPGVAGDDERPKVLV